MELIKLCEGPQGIACLCFFPQIYSPSLSLLKKIANLSPHHIDDASYINEWNLLCLLPLIHLDFGVVNHLTPALSIGLHKLSGTLCIHKGYSSA